MGRSNLSEGEIVKRDTASQKILQMAEMVRGLADSVAERAEKQLSPITREPGPVCSTSGEEKQPAELPPLFADLRSMLSQIETSLLWIDNVLDRAEV